MENFYLRSTLIQFTVKTIVAFLLLIALTTNAYAQLSGPETVCPGETTTYTYSGTDGSYAWTLTAGTGTITVANDKKSATVKWNNITTAATVNIKVTSGTTVNNYSVKVGIKSVNNYTPKAIEVYQNNVKQPISNVNGNNILKLDWC